MLEFLLLALLQAAPDRDSVLIEAVNAGDSARVSKLLAEGASPNARWRGYPVIVMALFSGKPETTSIVRALLKAGADPNIPGSDTKAAPQWAAERADPELLDALLENGVSPDWTNRNRESLLAMASAGGHAATVKRLLERGAKIDVQDDEGFTPLMNACQNRHVPVVRLLIEKGADKSLRSKYGDTAASLTAGKEETTQAGKVRREIADLLRAKP